ncbi:hypothetical protein BB561_003399 [Smittium simulii]|uniref:AMP-dependent synthetase/ligase domain-containing protein n=1 Tax=Smittium simulii TaxID=133385 RepID=A0A2T9YLK7_9FUNG|nr:hypothetical protein BB561_003399 [Smittium simulii]
MNPFDDNEYTDEYLNNLNLLIQEYEGGYLTELGYERKKNELTHEYERLVASLPNKYSNSQLSDSANKYSNSQLSVSQNKYPNSQLEDSANNTLPKSSLNLSQKSYFINSRKNSTNIDSFIKIDSYHDSNPSKDSLLRNPSRSDIIEPSSASYSIKNFNHSLNSSLPSDYINVSNNNYSLSNDSLNNILTFAPKTARKPSLYSITDPNTKLSSSPTSSSHSLLNLTKTKNFKSTQQKKDLLNSVIPNNLDINYTNDDLITTPNNNSVFSRSQDSQFHQNQSTTIAKNVSVKATNKKKLTHFSKVFDDFSDNSDEYDYTTESKPKPTRPSIYAGILSGRDILEDQFFGKNHDSTEIDSILHPQPSSIYENDILNSPNMDNDINFQFQPSKSILKNLKQSDLTSLQQESPSSSIKNLPRAYKNHLTNTKTRVNRVNPRQSVFIPDEITNSHYNLHTNNYNKDCLPEISQPQNSNNLISTPSNLSLENYKSVSKKLAPSSPSDRIDQNGFTSKIENLSIHHKISNNRIDSFQNLDLLKDNTNGSLIHNKPLESKNFTQQQDLLDNGLNISLASQKNFNQNKNIASSKNQYPQISDNNLVSKPSTINSISINSLNNQNNQHSNTDNYVLESYIEFEYYLNSDNAGSNNNVDTKNKFTENSNYTDTKNNFTENSNYADTKNKFTENSNYNPPYSNFETNQHIIRSPGDSLLQPSKTYDEPSLNFADSFVKIDSINAAKNTQTSFQSSNNPFDSHYIDTNSLQSKRFSKLIPSNHHNTLNDNSNQNYISTIPKISSQDSNKLSRNEQSFDHNNRNPNLLDRNPPASSIKLGDNLNDVRATRREIATRDRSTEHTQKSNPRNLSNRNTFLSTRAAKNKSAYFPPNMDIEDGATFERDYSKENIEFNLEENQLKGQPENYIDEIQTSFSNSQQKNSDNKYNDPINKLDSKLDENFYEKSFDFILNNQNAHKTHSENNNSFNSPTTNIKTPLSQKIEPENILYSNQYTRSKSKTIISFLEYHSKNIPNATAYTCVDNKGNQIGSLTWKQLLVEVKKLYLLLKKLPTKISKDDRVALVYRKYEVLDFICSLYACFIGGIIAIPLVACDSYAELAYVLRSTESKLVMTTDLNILSLNKDLNVLLTKNSETDPSNDFNKIWPKDIPWISANINVNNTSTFKNEQQLDNLMNFDHPQVLGTDLAYIEYSKSANGELKGISIDHDTLLSQCKVWARSTIVRQSNRQNSSASNNVSSLASLALQPNDINPMQRVNSPVAIKHFSDKQNNSDISKASKNSSLDANQPNGSNKSLLNMITNNSSKFRGLKNKKSIIGGDYTVINKSSGSQSNNAFQAGSKVTNQYSKSSFDPMFNPNNDQNFEGNNTKNLLSKNSMELISDSDHDSDLDLNFEITDIDLQSSLKSIKKDVFLTNIEPRQQFGLVYGIFSNGFSGNHAVHVSSVVCEDPAAYLYTIMKYKANIVAVSGYSELDQILKTVVEDPTKITKSNYFRNNTGLPMMPNLAHLRLILVDTMNIDYEFHQMFTSAVLMMFGCPVRKILQTQYRPVLTPIMTLAEYGGFLLAINCGTKIVSNDNLSNDDSNGELDFSSDVSGLMDLNLDRYSLGNGLVKPTSKKNSQNSIAMAKAFISKSLNQMGNEEPFLKMALFGLPSLGTEIVIVDPDTRFACDFDQVGEIWINSESAGSCFWGLPKLSKSIFEAKYNYYPEETKSKQKIINNYVIQSEKNYLRTGLMGAIIKHQVLVLGYYEDRLRCMAKKRSDDDFDIADISISYSLVMVASLKKKFGRFIKDCIFIETIVNNVHLNILFVECTNVSSNIYLDFSFNTLYKNIYTFLADKYGFLLFGIVFCKYKSLLRAYQYGKRQLNVALIKQNWELGKLKSYYTGLSFNSLFLALPSDIKNISNDKPKFLQDPSVSIFGVWDQITGYEPIDSSIDENSNIDLTKFESISELLVYRAQVNPTGTAYLQHDSSGNMVKSVSNKEFLYKVSFVVLFYIDKARIKPGEYVIISILSGIEFALAIHACYAVGAIPIPIAPIVDDSHLVEELASLVSTILHFKVKKILVNSDMLGDCLLNSKTAHVTLQPLDVTVCNISKVEFGSKQMYSNGADFDARGISNMGSPSQHQLSNGQNKVNQQNFEFGPIPKLILGQDSFKPYKINTKGIDKTAMVMLYGGAILDCPNFVSMTHRSILNFCAQQKNDFQMYYHLPTISSARCYSGFGFLQLVVMGFFCAHSVVILSPKDYFANPSIWLSLISKYRIKDVFATLPMLEHMISYLSNNINTSPLSGPSKMISFGSTNTNDQSQNNLGNYDLSISKIKDGKIISLDGNPVTLERVTNLIVASEERVPVYSINRIENTLSAVGLRKKVLHTLYGNLMNMCISSRAYLELEKLELSIDINAVQYKKVVLVSNSNNQSEPTVETFVEGKEKADNLWPSNAEVVGNSLILQDSGKVSGSTMVAIVDPSTKRISQVGTIGEIWVYSECNASYIELPRLTSDNIEQRDRSMSNNPSISGMNPNTSRARKQKIYLDSQSRVPVLSRLNTNDPTLQNLMFVCTGDYGFLHIDVSRVRKDSDNSRLKQLYSKSSLHSTTESNTATYSGTSDNSIEEPFLFVLGKMNESFICRDMLFFTIDLEATLANICDQIPGFFEEFAVIQTNSYYRTNPEITNCHDISLYNEYMNDGTLDSGLGPNDKILVLLSASSKLQQHFSKFISNVSQPKVEIKKKPQKPSRMNLGFNLPLSLNSSRPNPAETSNPENQSVLKNLNFKQGKKGHIDNQIIEDSEIGNIIAKIVALFLDRHKLAVSQVLILQRGNLLKRKTKLIERRQIAIKDMFYSRNFNVLSSYIL